MSPWKIQWHTPILSLSFPHKRVRLLPPSLSRRRRRRRANTDRSRAAMSGKYIIGSLVGSLGIAYVSDTIVSDKKIFGGTVCKTATDKEWFQATDAKFQAWPRVAGPPVIMNPISRQNFIVKDP
ncbi:uncharacterized protein [Triticum aestivum]|nr:uncharacterized protein LOC123170240 isoform X1 [Triticum aestivum]